MAKAQKRTNREAKKPKKKKEAAPVAVSMIKGITAANAPPKKKA